MSATISPPMFLYFPNNNNSGSPAVGFQLFTYQAGTNIKQATWTDSTQGAQNANPLPLDANGVAANGSAGGIWGDPTLAYKFVWAPANDTDPPSSPIRTIDNIYFPLNLAALTQTLIGTILYPRTAAEIAAGVTPTNYAYSMLNPWRYGADGNGGTNDTNAFNQVNLVIAQVSGINGWRNGEAVAGFPKTVQEAGAGVVPLEFFYPSDGQQVLNVFRFFTPAQIADVLAGTQTQDVSAAIQAANDYLEGKAPGAIATLTGLVGGSGYNGGGSGTFQRVALSGGAGSQASATVTVTSGVITAVSLGYTSTGSGIWQGNPGQNYAQGNTLSITAANLVAAGAAAGGSGATISVGTLATGGKTGTTTQGGTLLFPSGRYYCGTHSLRVGDMCRWLGTSVQGVQFTFSGSNANTARIVIGPGASGYNGRDGVYAMGSTLERCTVGPGGSNWGVYTTGLQQNGGVKNVWVELDGNSTGGVSLQDTFGSANMLCEDVYVFPPSGNPNASAVGFYCSPGVNLEVNRCSCNGSSSVPLSIGLRVAGNAGSTVKVKNWQSEITGIHIVIDPTFGEGCLEVDNATLNMAIGGTKGIWYRNTGTSTLIARGIAVGPSQLAIQNDNTGESITLGAAAGVIGEYIYHGTTTDFTLLQNVLIVPTYLSTTTATATPNIQSLSSFTYSVSGATLTINAPVMGPGALSTGTIRQGQRAKFTIRNVSGGAITTTWNAIFKKSAWTDAATGNSRSIEFEWNGTNWVQLWQSTVDVPN